MILLTYLEFTLPTIYSLARLWHVPNAWGNSDDNSS